VVLIRQVLGDSWSVRLLLLSLLAHLLLASSFHLSPDETQYALYSVNLGWSYFDHPPLVGWVQWPWAQLDGHDVLMRIVPMLSWALAAVGLMALTTELAPTQKTLAARAALLLWSLSPIPHLLGLALVPDTLLLPITCAVMTVTWRLCHVPHAQSWRLWCVLGVLLGLAGLTKYTAVLLAVGVVLALLRAHGGWLLKWPQPWVAVLLAVAVISPVILWNATHDWISFAYQFGHARGNAEWRLSRVAVFLIVQVLGYGLLLVVGSWSAWRLARRTRDSAVGEPQTISTPLFCACFGLPTLLLLTYLSGRGSTLPHWSAAAWAALVPVAALGCVALWLMRRKTMLGLGIFQAVSCVVVAGLMLSGGIASEPGAQATSAPGQKLPGAQFNPMADLYGWDAAARRARELAKAQTEGSKTPTLAVFNWTLASRIAWYAGPLPVKVVQRHLDQFGLWWGVLERGESVLLVDWSQMSFAPPVGADQFERCELLDQQPVMRWGRQIAHFNFMLCRNWQGPIGLPLETAR
jgi:4-amino-4-deoxy-L-arabinose transferase-like glycosyltransferase